MSLAQSAGVAIGLRRNVRRPFGLRRDAAGGPRRATSTTSPLPPFRTTRCLPLSDMIDFLLQSPFQYPWAGGLFHARGCQPPPPPPTGGGRKRRVARAGGQRCALQWVGTGGCGGWRWRCLCWASAAFVFVPVISDRPERSGRGSYATTYHLNSLHQQQQATQKACAVATQPL